MDGFRPRPTVGLFYSYRLLTNFNVVDQFRSSWNFVFSTTFFDTNISSLVYAEFNVSIFSTIFVDNYYFFNCVQYAEFNVSFAITTYICNNWRFSWPVQSITKDETQKTKH